MSEKNENILRIAGKPYLLTCSQPYKTSSDLGYLVNTFINGEKRTKIAKSFPSREDANEFYAESNNKFHIDFNDLSGNYLETEMYQTEEEALNEYSLGREKNTKKIESKLDREDEELLEEMNKHMSPKNSVSLMFDDEMSEDMDVDAKIADEVYENSTATSLGYAKDLLKSVAELYLSKDIIDKYPYIKNKLFYEEQSISNITLQIMISNRVLKKFYKEIMANPSSKNIETLSKLQKTILDISKYQREYLGDVEESIKKLKKDSDEAVFENDIVDTDAEEVMDRLEDGIISTNSRQKLIAEIQEIGNAVKRNEKIPLSPNSLLQEDISDEEKLLYEDEPSLNIVEYDDEEDESTNESKMENCFSSSLNI